MWLANAPLRPCPASSGAWPYFSSDLHFWGDLPVGAWRAVAAGVDEWPGDPSADQVGVTAMADGDDGPNRFVAENCWRDGRPTAGHRVQVGSAHRCQVDAHECLAVADHDRGL
jgi:hypothetical protein